LQTTALFLEAPIDEHPTDNTRVSLNGE